MLKTIAVWFGVVFIAVGILGFWDPVVPGDQLFGLFAVGPLHNWVHLITGLVALVAGLSSTRASRTFFQVFGIVYAVVAVLGFFYGNSPLLGIMAHDWADAWLHVAIAVFALYFGYGYRARRKAAV